MWQMYVLETSNGKPDGLVSSKVKRFFQGRTYISFSRHCKAEKQNTHFV